MPKPPDPFHEFVAELFQPLGPVTIKRMFGGAGVYAHDVMFALLADEQIYLKVDEALQSELEDEGSGPFRFEMKDGKVAEMKYFRLPDIAMDDDEEASNWGRKALDVALKAKSKKKPKRGKGQSTSAKKADNKTMPTKVSVRDFVNSVENETRRKDAKALMKIFKEITGMTPKMWGPSIIGYGRYHYKYDSGREGESLITGFSPRNANLVLYIMPGYADLDEKLSRLGKYKLGKSCLYVNKLADINEDVLKEIIKFGVDYMLENYQTWKK